MKMTTPERIVCKPVKIDFHIHSAASAHKDGQKVKDGTVGNIGVLFNKLEEHNVNMETFDGFFVTKNKKKDFEAISLRHNFKDRPDFERVLGLERLEKISGTSRVVEAYNYFRTNIDKELAEVMHLRTR